MNGKLIIRVGGGYMLIDEFLKNYAEQEREKTIGDESSFLDDSVDRSSPMKGKGSPLRKSPSPTNRK